MMKRRTFLQTAGILGVSSLSGLGAAALESVLRAQPAQDVVVDPLRALFERSLVIDALSLGHQWDLTEYEALAKTGYSGFQATLLNRNTLEGALGELNTWQRRIAEHPEKFRLATRADDFLSAKQNGQVAVLLGFQDCVMIGKNVDNLDVLHELGTRCLQLTYNYRNFLGNGCLERVDGGLSDFGIEAVTRMNELGILVDLSHCGPQTSLDGIAFSNLPAAFTHTMCESIYRDHPRAKTDEQIRAMAEKGGMTGITMIGYFVGPDPGGETTIENYINHIDHAVNIAGIDHVGMSSDFAIRGISPWATKETWYEPRLEVFKPSYKVRWPPWIPELDMPERFWNVTQALSRRGYSEDDIEKLLGANWVNLFSQVF